VVVYHLDTKHLPVDPNGVYFVLVGLACILRKPRTR
jgi:hypothetical protein